MQEVPGYGKCPARLAEGPHAEGAQSERGETRQIQTRLSELPMFSAGQASALEVRKTYQDAQEQVVALGVFSILNDQRSYKNE